MSDMQDKATSRDSYEEPFDKGLYDAILSEAGYQHDYECNAPATMFSLGVEAAAEIAARLVATRQPISVGDLENRIYDLIEENTYAEPIGDDQWDVAGKSDAAYAIMSALAGHNVAPGPAFAKGDRVRRIPDGLTGTVTSLIEREERVGVVWDGMPKNHQYAAAVRVELLEVIARVKGGIE